MTDEVLFHGTAHKFKKGDVVLPASRIDVERNWGAKSKNDPNYAYATNDVEQAKYFADVASFLRKNCYARVYQVEPVNPDTADWREKRFSGGRGGSQSFVEHASPDGYRVVKQIWRGRRR